ncbi:MAG TPA: fimbria/pilus periplasmic chaperone [Thermoanaerobaculia bacterium]|nr:fimbria/pilus periplasmic chaperone [Thermoanaerobaculia bacterium]
MKRLLTLSAIVLGLVLQAGNVSASAFRVTPIRVSLERSGASALLTLSNESQETLRFQISAVHWEQDSAGKMKLEPTQDILFFPALLSLEAGAERKVRVSARTPAGAVEKTYRIFFEELPPLTTTESREGATQVRILTKMGVPIFLAPQKVVEKATIERARVEQGTLRFSVKNEGTVRFGVQGVKVRGVGENDAILFEHELDGWYVLAGTERTYELPIAADVCGKLRSIGITAQTDSAAESAASAQARAEVSAAGCR